MALGVSSALLVASGRDRRLLFSHIGLWLLLLDEQLGVLDKEVHVELVLGFFKFVWADVQ